MQNIAKVNIPNKYFIDNFLGLYYNHSMKNSFGERLKILRFQLGLSQREIAERIGLSDVAYYKYEAGKAQPKLDVIKKLKNIFNVNIDWLLFGTGHMYRVFEFDEKILNDEDLADFFFWLNKEPMVRYAALSSLEDLKFKYPGKFSNKNKETKGESHENKKIDDN